MFWLLFYKSAEKWETRWCSRGDVWVWAEGHFDGLHESKGINPGCFLCISLSAISQGLPEVSLKSGPCTWKYSRVGELHFSLSRKELCLVSWDRCAHKFFTQEGKGFSLLNPTMWGLLSLPWAPHLSNSLLISIFMEVRPVPAGGSVNVLVRVAWQLTCCEMHSLWLS